MIGVLSLPKFVIRHSNFVIPLLRLWLGLFLLHLLVLLVVLLAVVSFAHVHFPCVKVFNL